MTQFPTIHYLRQTASGPCNIHPLLAKKIAPNLLFLQHHPRLPPRLGQVMAQVRAQWRDIVNRRSGEAIHPTEATHMPVHH